jgi:YidC/Oxa1 family membrane protein insertase
MTGGLMVFSILQPLEDAVRWLLERFHYDVGVTWAWAIVGTTLVVRILLVPLTVRQVHSMQALQRHAPEMKEIQRKYKGDRQRMNEEMMKFYKENKINPAASCLPLLAQAPVFISLYLVLRNFSKHVPAGSDLSWLHFVPDITAKANSGWYGYVLLAPTPRARSSRPTHVAGDGQAAAPADDALAPLIFITVIAHFPIGLVIYWVTTNLGRSASCHPPARPEDDGCPAAPRRSSRTPSPAVVEDARKRGRDVSELAVARSRSRRPPGSRHATATRQRNAGTDGDERPDGRGHRREAVGEAVEGACELELPPPLDKARCGSRFLEGERGLLGVGYTPARGSRQRPRARSQWPRSPETRAVRRPSSATCSST